MQTVTITRPSQINGNPNTQTLYIEREWDSYTGVALGRPVVLVAQPGHSFKHYEVLTDAEQRTIREEVDPTTLVKGDRIDAGGSRRNAEVHSVSEWGTGSISVMVISKGRYSQVWFKPGQTATKIG